MPNDESLPPKSALGRWLKLAGLSARLSGDALTQGIKKLTGSEAQVLSLNAAERIVETLGDLRGAAMKMGQMLSLDASLLTPEVQRVLSRLQNEAPPMDWDTVVDVVVDELGDAPETLFAQFEKKPHAAASLGQVHRARLHDGRAVAVKVQYPGVHEAMASDLNGVAALVGMLSAAGKGFDRRAYFAEVRRELEIELDYGQEALRREAFARAVAQFPDLWIPEVIANRSARRVLTLEWAEGPTLKDVMAGNPSPDERFRISRLLIRALQAPLLAQGVMHADPHPGNFVIRADGRLGVLDFGSVKTFSPQYRDGVRQMLQAALAMPRPDPYVLLRNLGFEFDLREDAARPLLVELSSILLRPFDGRDFDYAADTTFLDVKQFAAKHVGEFLQIRPPLESPLYGRAMTGLSMNLRRLGARGDFRQIYEELAREVGQP